jgi:hypothetical protein
MTSRIPTIQVILAEVRMSEGLSLGHRKLYQTKEIKLHSEPGCTSDLKRSFRN